MTVALKPHLSPCSEAIKWLLTQPDAETAWNACNRPNWMLWLAKRAGVEKPVFVRISCDIARTVLHFVPKGEDRPRLAIEAAEAWLANPNEENTMSSRAAARAADAADAYWAACAARAAADAAAYAAAYAAEVAANAAAYAAYEAAYAARAARAARAKTNANFADIIRKNIPFSAVSHLVET